MRVARYDYGAQLGDDLPAVVRSIGEAIARGDHGVDGEVRSFEEEFATFVGVDHAVGVNTGTDALMLALLAAGVQPGDEVVTQANTFNATVAAIVNVGASPVLVDADPETYLMDVAALQSAFSARTRAIIPVHLYGKPLELAMIEALAARHEATIVEDAAQAHGARWADGRCAGSRGALGCFSFHPSKNLAAAGDGGIVVTDDAAVAEELVWRRALGQRAQNDHALVGLNTKLHALQAIVLRAKLPKLEAWNAERRVIAGRYRAALEDLPVGFQQSQAGERHAYHLFQVRTEERENLLEHLLGDGVDAVVRYPVPIHLQPAFSGRGWRRGQFPVAEALARQLLCLPLRPAMAEAEIEHVIASVRGFFGAR